METSTLGSCAVILEHRVGTAGRYRELGTHGRDLAALRGAGGREKARQKKQTGTLGSAGDIKPCMGISNPERGH